MTGHSVNWLDAARPCHHIAARAKADGEWDVGDGEWDVTAQPVVLPMPEHRDHPCPPWPRFAVGVLAALDPVADLEPERRLEVRVLAGHRVRERLFVVPQDGLGMWIGNTIGLQAPISIR